MKKFYFITYRENKWYSKGNVKIEHNVSTAIDIPVMDFILERLKDLNFAGGEEFLLISVIEITEKQYDKYFETI